MKMTKGCFGFLVGMLLAGTLPAGAATSVWTNTAAGTFNWSSSGNWSNNVAPPSGGASDLTIQIYTQNAPVASGTILTLNNDLGSSGIFTLNRLILNGKLAAASTAYTNQGDKLKFVANGGTQPQVSMPNNGGSGSPGYKIINNDIILDNGVTLTLDEVLAFGEPAVVFNGAISGQGDIVTTNSASTAGIGGGIALNGNKTFTGNLIVNGSATQQRKVSLGGTNAFTGNVTINNNANLTLSNTNAYWSGATTIGSGGVLTFPLLAVPHNWTKDIVNNGQIDFVGTNTVSGVISGTGSISVVYSASSGPSFTRQNTFSGKTTIGSSGASGCITIDSIGNVDPSGAGPGTGLGRPDSVDNGTIVFWRGTMIYTGSGASSDRVISMTNATIGVTLQADGSGPLTLTGDVKSTGIGSKTLTLQGTNTGANTLSGAIYDYDATRITSVTKAQSGLWVLGGNNSVANYYSGTNKISAGTLRGTLGTGGSVGSGVLSLESGFNANAVFESSSDIVRPGGSSAGQMRIAQANVNAWSGFSAYGGNINVAFGTLGSPDALTWGTAPFDPGSSGKLILNAATADSTLDFKNAINLNAVTRTFRVDAATAILSGDLTTSSGTAGLTKEGAGTLVLSGNNTYNGVTTVSAGALRLASANALPGGIGVSGGTTNLSLAGGVVELGSGDFSRGLGTGATQVQFTSGGFSAQGAARTVNLGGATAGVTWNSGSFVTTTLILGSTTADNKLDFQNPINLNNAARTVRVDDNPATANDYAVLSGAVTNGALVKTGAGLLELAGSTNRFTGSGLTVSNGTLVVSGVTTSTVTTVAGGALIVNESLNGAITVDSGATIGGTGTVASSSLTLRACKDIT